jgi:hypothetical protein
MEDNQLHPAPDQVNLETGLSMWIIKDIRIWAKDYIEACRLYEIIDKF